MRLLGVVLAGGRSSRFGSDKALALLAGRTLLDHAIAGLAPHVEAVAICGRQVPGFAAIADRPRPGLGPLGGLAGALRYGADHGYAGVLTTGCDMPVFPPELAQALIGEGAAVLDSQPLAAFWPCALDDALDMWMAAQDDRSLRGFARHAGARQIAMPDLDLPNINRTEDLDALAKR
jgi:molybdopterin-guanine dinucleotide biosynthesis protein A